MEGGNSSKESTKEDISSIRAICQVSEKRAMELLEAASGSLQRAIEIHLQQGQKQLNEIIEICDENDDCAVEEPPVVAKRSREDTTPSPSKTSKKRALQGRNPSKKSSTSTSEPKQVKIQTFFGLKSDSPVQRKTRGDLGVEGAANKNLRKNTITKDGDADQTQQHDNLINSTKVNETLLSRRFENPIHKASSDTAREKLPKATLPDPRIQYSTLAKAFGQLTNTSKRNEKLNILKTVLVDIIEAVGGIHGQDSPETRAEDARILISALELVSGKISLGEKVAPSPLQVSGAAISKAIQAVTGVSTERLRESYRQTGDLGDAAAEFYDPSQSVKNFFVSKKGRDKNDGGASVVQLHKMLRSIAMVPQGTGSQKERHSLIIKLMRLTSSKEEVRFVTRALLGNMRLGATTKSIMAALAMAVKEVKTRGTVSTQDPVIQKLQRAFDICPRLDQIATAVLCGGIEYVVENCSVSVGVPIQPMLANPAHSLEEVEVFMTKKKNLSSCGAIAEWKYDGMRCQAHFDGTSVTLFSRHLRDSTQQFSDAVKHIMEAKINEVHSFIIDAEIVAVAPVNIKDSTKEGRFRLLPFQILSARRGIKARGPGDTVQIRVFVFDIMYLNGQPLVDKPLYQRIDALRSTFRETQGFTFASSIEIPSFDEAQISTYLREAVEGGAEGLMMKLTGKSHTQEKEASGDENMKVCTYESGTRSTSWLKVKRDYVDQFKDTIDVVAIGAWYGNGRKAERGFLSPILLAVYDDEDGTFLSISRCMSFTDEMYKAVKEFFFHGVPFPPSLGLQKEEVSDNQVSTDARAEDESELDLDEDDDNQAEKQVDDDDILDKDVQNDDAGDKKVNCFSHRPPSSVYVTNENPTIWFKPLEVWEVSFADLTLSRVHTAASGLVNDSEGRGIAMRFPRFIRRRPDKSVEQATTSAQIAELFNKQYKQA